MPQLFGFDKVDIPGPKPLPLVGSLVSIYKMFSDPVEVMMRLRDQGEVVALTDRNPAVIFVYGSERNREVLSQPATFRHDEALVKGPPGSTMHKVRMSMVTINGDTHKRHRRLMQPAFQKSALDQYAADIVNVTRIMLDHWKVGEIYAVDDLCRETTLAMAMKCFYGLDVGAEASELGQLAANWLKTITEPTTMLLPFNIPGLGYAKALKSGDLVGARLQALIDRKRQNDNGQTDALTMLLKAHEEGLEPFTDDELLAEAMTLFIAGHETTAITLTWTLFLLERHPDIHAALMGEIESVLGGAAPTPDDLPRMPVLDRVVKESMRIIPSVPSLFMRVCANDTTVGGHAVPKGSNIIISPIAAHHNAKLYPEPKRFRPDRWIGFAPSPYDYMPFGVGARACIGMLFAERALRLILPMILQRFRFSIPADTQIDRLTRVNILQPLQGLPMHIAPASAPAQPLTSIRGNIHELLDY